MAQTFPQSNSSDTTDQNEQIVEQINVTYQFTINDRELYMANFLIFGSDGIAHNTMRRNFSEFYSDNSEKCVVIIICVDRYIPCSTL